MCHKQFSYFHKPAQSMPACPARYAAAFQSPVMRKASFVICSTMPIASSLPSAILSKIRSGSLVECETCGRLIIP